MSSWLPKSKRSLKWLAGAGLGLMLSLAPPLGLEPVWAQASYFFHEVQPGQTLWSIAKAYKISVERLQEFNGGLQGSNNIKVGEFLIVPANVLERPVVATNTATTSNAPVEQPEMLAVLPSSVFETKSSPAATPISSVATANSPALATGNLSAGKSGSKKSADPKSTVGSARPGRQRKPSDKDAPPKIQTIALVPTSLPSATPGPVFTPGAGQAISGGRWHRGRDTVKEPRKDTLAPQSATQTKTVSQMLAFAKKFLGTPYVYGGDTPAGFDCSGYVQSVCRYAGVQIPRVADDQYYRAGKPVPKGQEKAGDLVFFETDPSWPGPSHVGICLGQGDFIHASSSSCVRIDNLSKDYYKARFLGSKRVLES